MLISVLVTLVLAGLLLWVVGQIPMDGAILRVLRAVVIAAVVLWLLSHLVGLPSWLRWR